VKKFEEMLRKELYQDRKEVKGRKPRGRGKKALATAAAAAEQNGGNTSASGGESAA